MRIAQIAPLYESVPPKLYGGTERVVSYLTEMLVELGHQVTLFASGDSLTNAELRPMCEQALRLTENGASALADHLLLLEKAFQAADEFDLVHSHIDYLALPLLRRMKTPHVTTLHGRLDIPNLQPLYREFMDEPLVSISDRQRAPLSWARWLATVHHGLPEHLHRWREKTGHYLAFIGRISPEKRVDDAIDTARRAGVPLKIAAKVDAVDRAYFEAEIKPMLGRDVEYIGEISESEKGDFLGNALALIFMIDWPEPFGLAMIEAMACGTPVVARSRGSVSEIVQHGANGFVVENVSEAVQAVWSVPRLSRRRCREIFEQRFTARRMAEEYVAVYESLRLNREPRPARSTFLPRPDTRGVLASVPDRPPAPDAESLSDPVERPVLPDL
jgi:glycosyltransferase involved in cell wall biosynthesis